MKKVLSIAIALCMMLTLTVCVFADDEVIFSEDTMFWSSGNWNDYTLENATITEFVELLQTEGAVLVVTRDTEFHIEHSGSETYEKILILNSWWSGTDVNSGLQWVSLGTAGHTSTTEPDVGIIDCISDDGVTVMWDGATVAQALIDGGFNVEGSSPCMIINCSADGAYKISNVSIIVTETVAEETAEEETTEEAEASETEETTESSESTETASASTSSPDTGVALALVPMAIAGIAVVSSKRR
ncbi:MAG: hypothetical protein LUH18_03475 [Oscillospiraceae bacterium]|nr:hypothetical protein [Oscillospiraceae bacterium]